MPPARLAGESLDTLACGDIAILQPQKGYRFSLDPLLLAAFAEIPSTARVADLGTGSGVLPLLLARGGKGREFVGIELQPQAAARAARSVALNGLSEHIRIIQADVRALPQEFAAGSFQAAVCNPPYRPAASGRLAPEAERGAARFELAGGLSDFLRAAAFLLADGGRFCIVHLAERLAELLDEMRAVRLEPKRLRMVHSRSGEPARLVLVEGRKNARPGLTVEAPLIVYREGRGREYTEEMAALLKR